MKIIFLDLDGVLNSAWLYKHKDYSMCITDDHYPGDLIEKDKLAILHRIIEETGAKVVFTTSWMSEYWTPERLGAFLSVDGIDQTWCTGGGLDRGRSVLDWVDAHDVESYVVVDDGGANMYDNNSAALWLRMVHVHGRYGLLPSDADKAIHILNNQPTDEIVTLNTYK